MSCCYCFPACRCLQPEEQLKLVGCTGTSVVNGPGCKCIGPCQSGERRRALVLAHTEYAIINDTLNGNRAIVKGPTKYFLGAFEEALGDRNGVKSSLTLGPTQYLITRNKKDGSLAMYHGPCVWTPQDPFEEPVDGGVKDAVVLSATQYIITHNDNDGKLTLYKGPAKWVPKVPFEKLWGPVRDAISLSPTQYIHVFNEQTGELTAVRGPLVWFPEDPFETVKGPVQEAIPLKSNEYIRVVDTKTGIIRVERGENLVFLSPTEKALIPDGAKNPVETAVNIDSQTAVIVRNTKTGQVNLITKKGLYFPTPYEVIESVQKKIILKDKHTIVLRDQFGNYHFKSGNLHELKQYQSVPSSSLTTSTSDADHERKTVEEEVDLKKSKRAKKGKEKEKEREAEQPEEASIGAPTEETERAFFIPPFWEIVKLNWSVGPRKDTKKAITVIDQRPHQMTYIFVCRTADSVELELDVSFYWQILDVPKMLQRTQDPTGDICFHARSVISQAISKLTLDKFMHSFNSVVSTAVLSPDDDFYELRGLKIHNAELRAMHCKDPKTEEVLQEIIKETTNRLNRLQKQTSDNEVQMLSMKGAIEKEKLNGELLQIRQSHRKIDALSTGESEAAAVEAFFSRFGGEKINLNTALEIWNALRRKEAIQSLSGGTAQLFVTPTDVNLNIATGFNPLAATGRAK